MFNQPNKWGEKILKIPKAQVFRKREGKKPQVKESILTPVPPIIFLEILNLNFPPNTHLLVYILMVWLLLPIISSVKDNLDHLRTSSKCNIINSSTQEADKTLCLVMTDRTARVLSSLLP